MSNYPPGVTGAEDYFYPPDDEEVEEVERKEMTHEEARERLSLVQGVLEEVGESVTDEQLQGHMDDAANNINSGIARLDHLTTGNGTSELKDPMPL